MLPWKLSFNPDKALAVLHNHPKIVMRTDGAPSAWVYDARTGKFILAEYGPGHGVFMEWYDNETGDTSIVDSGNYGDAYFDGAADQGYIMARGILGLWPEGVAEILYYQPGEVWGARGYQEDHAKAAYALADILEGVGFHTIVRSGHPGTMDFGEDGDWAPGFPPVQPPKEVAAPPRARPLEQSIKMTPADERRLDMMEMFGHWKQSMAERTGDPEIDTLIEQYIQENPNICGFNSVMPLDKYKQPEYAEGNCVDASQGFAYYLEEHGIEAYGGEKEMTQLFGDSEPRQDMYQDLPPQGWGYADREIEGYDMHNATVVYRNREPLYMIDWTAAQYGYKEWPMVQRLDHPGNLDDEDADEYYPTWQRKWTKVASEDPHDEFIQILYYLYNNIEEPYHHLHPMIARAKEILNSTLPEEWQMYAGNINIVDRELMGGNTGRALLGIQNTIDGMEDPLYVKKDERLQRDQRHQEMLDKWPKLTAWDAFRMAKTSNLVNKDYEGEVGRSDHITRRQTGTIPTSVIAKLQGARGEVPGDHRNRQGELWNEFIRDIQDHGINEPIFITVDYGEQPVISEGNHRRDAAVELGLPEVPVEIKYFGHAEQLVDLANPV